LTILSGCGTKTIVRKEPIEIPEKYLVIYDYINIEASESDKSDLRKYSAFLFVENLELEDKLNRCNQSTLDLIKYQKLVKSNE